MIVEDLLRITIVGWKMLNLVVNLGPEPIKNFQRKLYATLIFKHFDWLTDFFQSIRILKNCIA